MPLDQNPKHSPSTHCRSQQLNISETSLRWILHKELGMTPYKVQLVQELKPIKHPMRFRFAKWACGRLTKDADFGKKKSSWSSFWSCRACKQAKLSHLAHRKPARIHWKADAPKRVTVWCGFWFRGLIGPFFFENEQGEFVTVNGDRYRAMLNEFLFTKIEEENIGNIWFQQDGAM